MLNTNYTSVPAHLNNKSNLEHGKMSVLILGDGAPMRIYALIGMMVQSMMGMGYSIVCHESTANLYEGIMMGMVEDGVLEHGVKVLDYMEQLEHALSEGKETPKAEGTIAYMPEVFAVTTAVQL